MLVYFFFFVAVCLFVCGVLFCSFFILAPTHALPSELGNPPAVVYVDSFKLLDMLMPELAVGVDKEVWIFTNGSSDEPLTALARSKWVKAHVLAAVNHRKLFFSVVETN